MRGPAGQLNRRGPEADLVTGRFEISELAGGGMGTVFRAEDRESGAQAPSSDTSPKAATLAAFRS